ncbi:Dual-specificity RNA methyltransferase RlmN [Candidatus Zixiibacteriota bacterium]|nr:Dual-specificity RNA methyltransferase RlmN [candidate division Zixibacteria bacterium]
MERINLLGRTVAEMQDLMLEMGEKPFKGRQLFKWLYGANQPDFLHMTDLSLSVRHQLAEKYRFEGLVPEKISRSRDGTEKILFRLDDGNVVETVMIPEKAKKTICVSSQVGCALGCRFCATGKIGFKRNLTTGEIVGQLLFIRRQYGPDSFQNIVFMGMGEPLMNFPNLISSIGIISSELGLALSAKKITVSTVGLVPKIYELADTGLKVNLAVSLHAATDEKRRAIMPVSRGYILSELMDAARYFTRKRKKRITFEYILFEGFNDSFDDVLALSNLIKGIPCKINILAYNPVGSLPYNRPSDEKVDEFGRLLYPRAPAVTVRKSRGLDIDAACGQLAGKYLKSL